MENPTKMHDLGGTTILENHIRNGHFPEPTIWYTALSEDVEI